jgi:DMSO/TMAO reductase YedYZ molybdopterin-dependent catalytic subunit
MRLPLSALEKNAPARFMSLDFDRRCFLQTGIASVAVAMTPQHVIGREATADVAGWVPRKDGRLIVHNAKTLEIETPLELLRNDRLTPKSVLFVRNNQELADTRTTSPASVDDWEFDIVGMVETPRTISPTRLRDMRHVDSQHFELVQPTDV